MKLHIGGNEKKEGWKILNIQKKKMLILLVTLQIWVNLMITLLMKFMKEFLTKSGFKKIDRVKSFSLFKDTSDYAPYGPPISLNLIAYK